MLVTGTTRHRGSSGMRSFELDVLLISLWL